MLQDELRLKTNDELLAIYFRNGGCMTAEGFADPGPHDRETMRCSFALLTLSMRKSGARLLSSTLKRFKEHKVDAFGEIRFSPKARIDVRGRTLYVTRVREPHSFWRALTGRLDLQRDEAVLFKPEYPVDTLCINTMQGRTFPVDALWLEGRTITDLQSEIPVPQRNSRPVTVEMAERIGMADRVLVLKAGEIERRRLRKGDTI